VAARRSVSTLSGVLVYSIGLCFGVDSRDGRGAKLEARVKYVSAVTHEFSPGALIPGTRYRVVRLIGEGGMGWIFDVEHIELGKRFVLKVLRPQCARRSDLVARLRNEWRALGQLQHPNIVAATDAGDTADQIPFFVMERLEGEPLARRLRREGRLSIPVALHIAASVLEGLAAAHEIGIVHRDIKPPNVFLVRGGGVKLLDFGVAKFDNPAAQVVTAHGVAIGTPRYMSPEQANGAPIDGRADLYATGLILFELITGQSPFEDARDTSDLIVAHLAREAPRLASLLPGVSPELDQIVARLLAKDPRDRPSNARELAAALRTVAARARRAVSTDASTVPAHYSAPTICAQAAAGAGLLPLAHRALSGASSTAHASPVHGQSGPGAATLSDDALQDATTRLLARGTERGGRAGPVAQASTQSCTTPGLDSVGLDERKSSLVYGGETPGRCSQARMDL
jgi:serine/threonine protein kinase